MRPLAYSYGVDEAGFVWRFPRDGRDSPIAQFSLSGVWPQSPGIAQAPRADQRDLLRVAAAVAAADRLSPRQPASAKQTERQLYWQRDLRLRIAVESPERWRSAARLATDVLDYLTADRWELEFESLSRPFVQVPLAIASEETASEVALFSGGLDSAAGPLAREDGEPGLAAVSVCGTPVRAAAQRSVIDYLRTQGLKLRWIPVEHQLRREAAWGGLKEMPQRGRGFLFLAVGAVVASILRAKRLLVYETGVGALNLRPAAGQVAAQTTRAVHPRTLLLIERLFPRILGESIPIELPFLFRTKKEVCRSLGLRLPRVASITMSCDEGEGHKAESMQHCGICTSCLFRRVALHGTPDPTRYRSTASRSRNGYDVAVFEMLALRIQRWNHGFVDLLDADPDAGDAVLYAARFGKAPKRCGLPWWELSSAIQPRSRSSSPPVARKYYLHHYETKRSKVLSSRELGRRVAAARRRAGLTQSDAAQRISMARTTLVAIEKGERALSSAELVRLAAALGIEVHDLVGAQHVDREASPRFRLPSTSKVQAQALSEAVERLRRMACKYAELERIHEIVRSPAPLEALRTYQAVAAPSAASAATAGRDAALTVRSLFGLGDEPALDLERRFESEAGLRIFHPEEMPSGLSAILLWGDDLGACVALNPAHPHTRRRWSLVHEVGHFLRDRELGDVYEDDEYAGSRAASEVFSDTLAGVFLMPESGVARRFAEIGRVNGRFTARDLAALASVFQVAFRAMAQRLEELKLLPKGTYERIRASGLRPTQMAPEHARGAPPRTPIFPPRYVELRCPRVREGTHY